MVPSEAIISRKFAPLTRSALWRYASSVLLWATVVVLLIHSAMLAGGGGHSVTLNLLLEILLLIAFWWWCSLRSKSLIAAPFVFVFTIFFWHSGFLAGRAFQIDEIFAFPGSVLTYGEEYVPLAVALISACMGLAVVGSIVAYAQTRAYFRRRAALTRSDQPETPSFAPDVQRYAWFLFTAYLLLSFAYQQFEAQSGSYADLYSTGASGTLLYRLYQMTKFLGVAAIGLVIAFSRSKAAYRTAVVSVLFLAFMMAMTGARTMPFLFVATLVAAIDYFRHRVSLKTLVALSLAAATISWVMSEARASGIGLHVFSLSAAGDDVSLWHLVWNSGGSVRAVLRTMAFTAQTPPAYGETFLQALVYVVPSPVVAAIFPAWRAQPPSEWMLEESLDVPRGAAVGMGYSLVAEIFLNFRFFGALLFLVVGWLIAFQYFKFRLRGDQFSGLQALNLTMMLALHLRNDTMTYARVLVWAAAAIWFGRFLDRRWRARAAEHEPQHAAQVAQG